MDSGETSHDWLAHFDSAEVDAESRRRLSPSIGVSIVLKWAAAATVLFLAACVVLKLAYCIAAEQALTRAARAAAFEATLPRATRESIVATIENRLLSNSIATNGLKIHIQHNNRPIGRVVRLAEDDEVSVAVSVPADAILPTWLNATPLWRGGALIEARAERSIPNRYLSEPR
jgi:hypothetical protein